MHSYMGSSMQIKERLIETSFFLALSPKTHLAAEMIPMFRFVLGQDWIKYKKIVQECPHSKKSGRLAIDHFFFIGVNWVLERVGNFFKTQENEVMIFFPKSGCTSVTAASKMNCVSHQDSMVLAKRQTYRSMEQNRKPRDKSTHIWTPYLWQRRQEYTME